MHIAVLPQKPNPLLSIWRKKRFFSVVAVVAVVFASDTNHEIEVNANDI